MKIILTLEEVKAIVVEHIRDKGLNVFFENAEFTKHTEGTYDEATEVIDGIAFELGSQVLTG